MAASIIMLFLGMLLPNESLWLLVFFAGTLTADFILVVSVTIVDAFLAYNCTNAVVGRQRLTCHPPHYPPHCPALQGDFRLWVIRKL